MYLYIVFVIRTHKHTQQHTYTHTHSLSLSLSLSHTHTHTHTPGHPSYWPRAVKGSRVYVGNIRFGTSWQVLSFFFSFSQLYTSWQEVRDHRIFVKKKNSKCGITWRRRGRLEFETM